MAIARTPRGETYGFCLIWLGARYIRYFITPFPLAANMRFSSIHDVFLLLEARCPRSLTMFPVGWENDVLVLSFGFKLARHLTLGFSRHVFRGLEG